MSCKQNSTVKILVSISCAARLLVRRPRGVRGRVALRRGRPRHVWARGLTVNLNPGKEGRKNKKDPETEESTGGWRTGSEPGQEVRGYVNTKKVLQGGVWSLLSWVMRSTPPGPRNI